MGSPDADAWLGTVVGAEQALSMLGSAIPADTTNSNPSRTVREVRMMS